MALAERRDSIRLEQCIKISYGDVAALGTAFAQMIPSLRTISIEGMGYIPVNMEAGAVLKTARDGLNWGAHVTKGGKSVFTKWAKAGPSSAVMPVNPAAIMMAATLANIEKKLNKIQETQLQILSFLEQDKQAEQQGNLNVLTDILDSYKHNWDNEAYLRNHHMKVLDIKQSAEKNTTFFQEQIAAAIKSLPAIYMDGVVRESVGRLEKLFGSYRMALYLFAFSSFLEVMLLGNFKAEYLSQVAGKVSNYNERYQVHFYKSRDMVHKLSSASVETMVLSGLGNASKALGKLVATVPVLSQGPVDEWLQDGGEKLLKGNEKKVARRSMFDGNEKIAGNLHRQHSNVGMINNKTTDILFDGDALYLAVA